MVSGRGLLTRVACFGERRCLDGKLSQRLNSNILQLLQVSQYPVQLVLVLCVVRLLLKEVVTLITESKGGEHEALDGVREVSVLGFLAVLVHDIANDVKLDVLFADEAIVLRVSVREQNHHGVLQQGLGLLVQDSLAKDELEELTDDLVHFRAGQ